MLDHGQRAYRDKGPTPVLGCGDRLPNFRDSRSDFTRTDGKEAVNGFPAKKFRRGRACRFPTNSILRLLPREGQTDFQHSGASLLRAFERKNERISNIRATINRRSNRHFAGRGEAMSEAKLKTEHSGCVDLRILSLHSSVMKAGKPASPGIQTVLRWG